MSSEKMTDEEVREMFRLIKRYATLEMDQWDMFKFDSKYGQVYVNITRSLPGGENMCIDVNHLLDTP